MEQDPVEQAIIRRLQERLGDELRIEAFPLDLSVLAKPVTRATVFVGFRGDRLEIPELVNPAPRLVTQKRFTQYDTILRVAELRGHQAVKPVADRIQLALTGFVPAEFARPLFQVRGGFSQIVEGLLFYSQTFEFYHPYSQEVY